MKNKKLSIITFVFCLLVQIFTQTASAQNGAGTPDPTFGKNGQIVTTPPGDLGNYSFRDLALQPDGKIIAAGAWIYIGMDTSFWRFVLIRYNADGSLDTTFGSNGVASYEFGGIAELRRITLQPDGKVLAIGEYIPRNIGISSDIIIARYNTNGSLDNSFGENGIVITDLASFEVTSWEEVENVYLLPDGKIVLVAFRSARHFNYEAPVYNSAVILRYNADGTLDSNFGNYGKIISNIITEIESPRSSVLLPDGKLLILTSSCYKSSDCRMTVFKYNPDGSLDTNFLSPNLFDYSYSGPAKIISLQDQKTLVRFNTNFYLLNSDGSFNRIFLSQFQLPTPVFMKDFIAQDDGKLIILGDYVQSGTYSFGFTRILSNGEIDAAFGMNGTFMKNSDFAVDTKKAIIQRDGKLLGGGGVSLGSRSGFIIFRHLGDPAASGSSIKTGRRGF